MTKPSPMGSFEGNPKRFIPTTQKVLLCGAKVQLRWVSAFLFCSFLSGGGGGGSTRFRVGNFKGKPGNHTETSEGSPKRKTHPHECTHVSLERTQVAHFFSSFPKNGNPKKWSTTHFLTSYGLPKKRKTHPQKRIPTDTRNKDGKRFRARIGIANMKPTCRC